MIEVLASDLTGEHLDKPASASWRGLWSAPRILRTFDRARDPEGKPLMTHVVFAEGTSITDTTGQLRIRVWPTKGTP